MSPVWLCSCDMPGPGDALEHTVSDQPRQNAAIWEEGALLQTPLQARRVCCGHGPRSSRSLLAEGGGDFQHPARPLLEATSRWSHVTQHGQRWVKSHARILRASPAADGSGGRTAGTGEENRAGPEQCWEGGYRTGEAGGSGAVVVPDGRT